MFRTRRQNRYKELRHKGFLKFEADPLSRVPFKTAPYWRAAVRERYREFIACKGEKISQPEYKARIKQKYIIGDGEKPWLKKDKAGRQFADPWQYLRDCEDRWRAKVAAYESPWERRRKSFKDFMARIERDLGERRYGERRGYLEPQQ